MGARWPSAPARGFHGRSSRLETAGELGVLRGPIPYPPLVPIKVDVAPTLGFVTDAKGAFRISGLPAGKVVVSASHPQFAVGRSTEIVLTPGAVVETRVILRRGTSLRGVVVDERGRGLAGAEVSCNDLPAGRSDKGGGFGPRAAGRAVHRDRPDSTAIGRRASSSHRRTSRR